MHDLDEQEKQLKNGDQQTIHGLAQESENDAPACQQVKDAGCDFEVLSSKFFKLIFHMKCMHQFFSNFLCMKGFTAGHVAMMFNIALVLQGVCRRIVPK